MRLARERSSRPAHVGDSVLTPWKIFLAGCLDLGLEARCAFCHDSSSLQESFFCEEHRLAHDRLAWGSGCVTCGMPRAPRALQCVACRGVHPPELDLAVAFAFEGNARRALLDAKLARRTALLQPLAAGLAERLAHERWAFGARFVPIPLHRSRRRKRGFNQSALLCEHLADRLGGRVWHALKRVRATEPQGRVALTRRAENLRGAFACRARPFRSPPRGPVVVVDDVMTSGTTLREALRTLKRAGVRDLHGAVACRTLPPAHRGWRG